MAYHRVLKGGGFMGRYLGNLREASGALRSSRGILGPEYILYRYMDPQFLYLNGVLKLTPHPRV